METLKMKFLIIFLAPFISGHLTNTDISLALSTANKALNYLLKNNAKINLDGALGARMMEGALGQIIDTYESQLPTQLKEGLIYLHHKSSMVGYLGGRSASLLTPFYYSHAHFLLEPEIWNFLMPKQTLPILEREDEERRVSDDVAEDVSDYCLSEFVPKNGSDECNVSQKCFATMNAKHYTSYSLTHQVLYYLVGFGYHCGKELEYLAETDGESVIHRLTDFCSRIEQEAQMLANLDFPKETRDLFMEQIGLCGIAGFTDVAHPEWLQHIASWQSESGCYHRFQGEKFNMENFNPKLYGNHRKRSEQAMSQGPQMCLSHRTSVALVALTAYIRKYVEENVVANFGFSE